MTHSDEPILQVKNLKTYFKTDQGLAKAVDDVSFSLSAGTTLSVVGESGCGKSVTALSVMGLVPQPPGVKAGGQILFEGRDLRAMPERQLRAIRGNDISMIFQEPMSCLDPTATIGEQLEEAVDDDQLSGYFWKKRQQRKIAATNLLHKVGIKHHEICTKSYPHQLTEALCQRVMIAMALAGRPMLLIADEPTAAMESSNQGKIFRLLASLNQLKNMSIAVDFIFSISNDFEFSDFTGFRIHNFNGF